MMRMDLVSILILFDCLHIVLLLLFMALVCLNPAARCCCLRSLKAQQGPFQNSQNSGNGSCVCSMSTITGL